MGGGTGQKGGYKNDDAEGMCNSVASLEPDPRYEGCCSNIFRPGRIVRDLVVGGLVVLGIAVVIAVIFVVCFFFMPGSEGESPLLGEESAFHGKPYNDDNGYRGINEVEFHNDTRYDVDPVLERIKDGKHDHTGHEHHEHHHSDHEHDHTHHGHDRSDHEHEPEAEPESEPEPEAEPEPESEPEPTPESEPVPEAEAEWDHHDHSHDKVDQGKGPLTHDHTHPEMDHDHTHPEMDHDHTHPEMDHDHTHPEMDHHDHTHPEMDHNHTHPEMDHHHTHDSHGTLDHEESQVHQETPESEDPVPTSVHLKKEDFPEFFHPSDTIPGLFGFRPTEGSEGTLRVLNIPHEDTPEEETQGNTEVVPTEAEEVTEPVTESVQGECRPRQLEMCSNLPYTMTSFPNWAGDQTVEDMQQTSLPFLRDVIVRSRCSPRAKEYSCAILEPPCNADGNILPPCRTFCKSVAATCQEFITSRFSLSSAFDCEQFPDSADPNVCFDMTQGPCLGLEHQCGDGRCVAKRLVCDGHMDCLDQSDEAECPGQVSADSIPENTTSPIEPEETETETTEPTLMETTTVQEEAETITPTSCPELKCLDGSCILLSQVNDGVVDCPGGIDEEDFGGLL